MAFGLLSCAVTDMKDEKKSDQAAPVETGQPAAATFLALGDSYTIGEAVAENGRWPVQLADSLSLRGFATAPPRILARTGWTTGELKSAIAREDIKEKFSLVSLLIGVNDQYRKYDIGQYPNEFRELLKTAIAFADGNKNRVFVVSIPDYGATPFVDNNDKERVRNDIDAYNAINRRVASEEGVHYFDITPISRQALDNPALTATDKLHPSAEMYRQWVALMLPGVAAMLQ